MFRSLVGGMGASRVVETLSRTGGFGVNVCRRRLLETLQHYMDVVEDLDAMKPGGKGYVSSVRVRLLHATVRRRIMGLERQKPGYFDMKTLGVPINDLHQMGTISVYSASVAFTTLPRQNVTLTKQQTADYIALWRYVGYLLGTPVDWMATPEKAKAMMESIMVAEINPSNSSKILANNILTAETNVPPLNASREFLAAHAYNLNGDSLATELAIEKPGAYYRFMVWLQCLFFLFESWTYPMLPPYFQRRRDQVYLSPNPARSLPQVPSFPNVYLTELPRLRAQDDHEPEDGRHRGADQVRVPVRTQPGKAHGDGPVQEGQDSHDGHPRRGRSSSVGGRNWHLAPQGRVARHVGSYHPGHHFTETGARGLEISKQNVMFMNSDW